jgi:hypothetical protein
MPYASGRVIHDADAHIMDVPGFLEEHLEAKYRAQVTDAVLLDYPHVEGGRHPIKRFEASMAAAGTSEPQKQRFYCDNFVDLMGAGLAPELRAAA